MKIIASLVPRDINLNPAGIENLSDDELLDALEQVRTIATLLTTKTPKRH